MRASVIIITKNQKELLRRSLPVLLRQDLKNEFEIIIVDSGSTDGAREYIQTLPVKLIRTKPESFNFASAFNVGAKEALGEFLIRLSGDVVPKKKDFISQMIKSFGDPRVGGAYGKYTLSGKRGYTYPFFWPAERFPSKVTRYSIKPNLIRMLFDKRHMGDVLGFAGGCCAVKRSTWEKRHFNERLFGAEDAEYALYLHLEGLDIVYNPKAEVVHEHKITDLRRDTLSEIKWRVALVWECTKLFL